MAFKINKKKVLRVSALSFSNALLMMWLTFTLLSYPYVFFDEFPLIRYSSAVKNLILKWEKPPNPDRFAFINIAWDKALIDKNDSEGFPIGYQPITDREKLAQFFTILSKKPNYKFMVCDIEFKDSTEYDSTMLAAIKKLPRMAVSYHRDDNDKPVHPDVKIPKSKLSLSDLEKTSQKAVKFKLFHNDSLKSTPLIMYEGIHPGEKFEKNTFYYSLGGRPIFNSFIIDYRIRPYGFSGDAQVNDSTHNKKGKAKAKPVQYSKIYLGELLALLETDDDGNVVSADGVHEFVKDRIVFIGDFTLTNGNDIHETIYGDTQGPLILLNAFLALENRDNQIKAGFVIYLLLAYWFISFITFYYRTIYGKWIQKLTRKSDAGSFLASMTVFASYFMVISIVSFFLFNIHVGTIILAFYMNLIEKGKNLFNNKFSPKQEEEKAV
ncbi:CHASE2 domain-containing protein [Microscilla marina]|uniref:Uncharacterized protein n=1 Tax=Microscilla marina ATCC 23134 TaxID=313606 RepID=A1ZH79_MICM2|nr:CHASE2 domain-containing protein [Microscilla marina]EAY30348.1 hypothetical protein M23134_08177 [Microscilla marina ATCC 23134]